MKKKLNKNLINKSKQLAARGFTDKAICSAVNIGYSTLYSAPYLELLEAIRETREETRNKVMQDLLNRSESDTSASSSIYLANKLQLFKTPYPTSKPKSISEALDRLSQIYFDVASGDLDADAGNKLSGYLMDYCKLFESSVLEERLSTLEERLLNEN